LLGVKKEVDIGIGRSIYLMGLSPGLLVSMQCPFCFSVEMDMQQANPREAFQRQMRQALEDPEIPRIHFNGFINSMGGGDVLLVLQQNEKPVAVLNASFTVAKTLAKLLGEMIENLETKTGNTIMTTDEIASKLMGGQP